MPTKETCPQDILDAEANASRLEGKVAEAKGDLKELKDEYDAALEHLRMTVRRYNGD